MLKNVISIYLLVEERILLAHDLMFVQVDDIHLIHLINILHIVLENRDHKDLNEAEMIKEMIKNVMSIYVLVEERILLDHDLMFVQVDDIHQIDLFHNLHIVLQNRDYIYLVEAIIK